MAEQKFQHGLLEGGQRLKDMERKKLGKAPKQNLNPDEVMSKTVTHSVSPHQRKMADKRKRRSQRVENYSTDFRHKDKQRVYRSGDY